MPILPNALSFNIIFLPIILFIGFITSYEDFKTSKIKNKWVILGLSYSLSIYLFIWILGKLGLVGSYLIWNFDKWCINLLISTVVAYLLWHFKMWAAGDAKLFICYSALIPIGQYSKVYFNYYFASFLLLLAIFIPATVFLFLKSMVYFIKKFDFSEIKKKIPKLVKEKFTKFNRIEIGKVLLGFFVFFLFLRILWQHSYNLLSKILPNQNILVLISLLAFPQLSKIFKKNIKFMPIAFIVLLAYFSFKIAYSWRQSILEIGNIFGRSMLIMILFPLFRKVINLYEERTIQKTTPFAIWMFLGVLIIWFL